MQVQTLNRWPTETLTELWTSDCDDRNIKYLLLSMSTNLITKFKITLPLAQRHWHSSVTRSRCHGWSNRWSNCWSFVEGPGQFKLSYNDILLDFRVESPDNSKGLKNETSSILSCYHPIRQFKPDEQQSDWPFIQAQEPKTPQILHIGGVVTSQLFSPIDNYAQTTLSRVLSYLKALPR